MNNRIFPGMLGMLACLPLTGAAQEPPRRPNACRRTPRGFAAFSVALSPPVCYTETRSGALRAEVRICGNICA